jgi:hypothetical protein
MALKFSTFKALSWQRHFYWAIVIPENIAKLPILNFFDQVAFFCGKQNRMPKAGIVTKPSHLSKPKIKS